MRNFGFSDNIVSSQKMLT